MEDKRNFRLAILTVTKTESFFVLNNLGTCNVITLNAGDTVYAEMDYVQAINEESAFFTIRAPFIWVHTINQPNVKLLVRESLLR